MQRRTALCFNFAGIMAVRFFLGLMESITGPVFVIVTSNWWTRPEQAFRTAFWIGGTPVSNPLVPIYSRVAYANIYRLEISLVAFLAMLWASVSFGHGGVSRSPLTRSNSKRPTGDLETLLCLLWIPKLCVLIGLDVSHAGQSEQR